MNVWTQITCRPHGRRGLFARRVTQPFTLARFAVPQGAVQTPAVWWSDRPALIRLGGLGRRRGC